jgi:hypothetical protein
MTVSMTQKSAKKKSKKSAKAGANPSVLGSLRSTRPTRLGGDRRAGATASRATAAKPKATRSPAAKPEKAKAKAKTKAATKSPAAATQPKATAAHRPTPPPPPPRPANGRPSGTEIVTTAVQAVGELAQIGATVGTQLLKRAAQRLPRP